MDTSDYPSLPNLSQMNARLAIDARRVEAVIDSQLDSIERLLSAVIAEDWKAVAAASRDLAALKPDVVGEQVVREARHVCEELSLREDTNRQGSTQEPKHLANLLAACRSVRKNWTSSS